MTQTEPPSSRRPLLGRIIGRLRHGLLLQEFLDLLAKFRVALYPYFVTVERHDAAMFPAPDSGFSFRALGPEDAPQIVRITLRPRNVAALCALMSRARCIGAFRDGQLAGYSWADHRCVRVIISDGQCLFKLEPNEAYLFDMYVAPQYRGLRLAVLLRREMYQALALSGISHFYSITLATNRSSRQFKERLGAQEVELRFRAHLRLGRLPGIDFRVRRLGERLRTPAMRRVAQTVAAQADE